MKLTEIVTLLATVLVAGWFSSLVVQFVKQSKWASWVKLVVSGIVATAVAVAALWLSGDVTSFLDLYKAGTLSAEHIVTFATLTFSSAVAWYKLNMGAEWFENLGNWPKKSE